MIEIVLNVDLEYLQLFKKFLRTIKIMNLWRSDIAFK